MLIILLLMRKINHFLLTNYCVIIISMKEEKLPLVLAAVDLCIFKIINNSLCVYISKSNNKMNGNLLCMPGALINKEEHADQTLVRLVKTKTNLNIKNIYCEQLYSFSDVKRDKRSRVISVAYLCLYTGAETDGFVDISSIKKLAYDHNQILNFALDRLKSKLEYTTIIQRLMKKTFIFSEMQKTYETILNKELDKRNFRKKIENLNILKETGNKIQIGKMRPAKEYSFADEDVKYFKLFGEL